MHMETINIICVDDQAEVLDSVVRDLKSLESFFRIEGAESAADCRTLMSEIEARGEMVGLVISDHVMPGENGVSLLSAISLDSHFVGTRRILLTGQANHADTIHAVNDAHIDNYIEKPWVAETLLATAKRLLTKFIMDKGIDYEEFMRVLDQQVLLTYLK